jgi:hypothetical protein
MIQTKLFRSNGSEIPSLGTRYANKAVISFDTERVIPSTKGWQSDGNMVNDNIKRLKLYS